MRDNHKGLPEIINAYERDGHFFGSVSLTIRAATKVFEFGIDQDSYKAIKNILYMKPFEQFPGAEYRYFFSPKVRRNSRNRSKTYCAIRIEQNKYGKEFEVSAPESLIANLMWFFKVKDYSEVNHLREIHV